MKDHMRRKMRGFAGMHGHGGPRGGRGALFGNGDAFSHEGDSVRRRGHGHGGAHFGGRDHSGPRGGIGGRRKRLFDQAELQALLLALIVRNPRHGYELIREIEALSGGDYAPSPGVVYPALAYMEEAGLIAATNPEGPRKAYEATEAGRAQAAADEDRVVKLTARLSALAQARELVDPAPVRRAMHALKTAMFDRLSKEGTDRDVILQIADAIDEATRKIERIEK